MKKVIFLTALAALALLASCNKENGGKEDVGKKELTIKASINNEGLSWKANDEILVTCDGEAYSFKTTGNGQSADFTSADGLTQEMVGINPLTAFYGCTQFGAFTIPQNQVISGTESQTKLPMYAYTTTAPENAEVAMNFFPAASLLEVNISPIDITLNSVGLSPVDETAVAGNVAGQHTVNPVTGKVTSTGNLKSITATIQGGANLNNGLSFRFPIGWFSVSGGMRITLTYNGNETYEDVIWADNDFQSYTGSGDAKSFKAIAVDLEVLIGARDFYVAPDGRVGSKGVSADDPATLDYALSSADEGSVIHLAAGTYKPTRALLGDESGLDVHKTFEIARGLTLIGTSAAETILSGDGAYHAVCVTAPATAKVIFKNLSITGGNTSAAAEDAYVTSSVNEKKYFDTYGAGLYAVGAEIEMEDVIIKDNAGNRAVGAYISDLKASLKNVEVSGNSSTGNGTGLWAASCDMTLTSCSFTGNNGKGVAAGLYVFSDDGAGESKLVATDCIFKQNVTSGNDAGLYIRGANATVSVQATLTNCLIENNQANMGAGFGVTFATALFDKCIVKGNVAKNFDTGAATNGANLVYPGANVTIRDCIFRDNTAGLGAAIYQYTNTEAVNLTVIGSEFSSNTTAGRGGAIYVRSAAAGGATLNMVNSTIFNNTSGSTGSAVAFYSGNTSFPANGNIYNCTIVNNTCTRASATPGGAIGVENAGCTIHIYNSIVSGNKWEASQNNANVYCHTSSSALKHRSIIGTDTLYPGGAVITEAAPFDPETMLEAKTAEGKTSVFKLVGTDNPAKTYGYSLQGLKDLNAPFEDGVIEKDQWGNARTGSVIGAYVE